MKPVRLLPVVILAVAALLVLKTLGLVMTGSYVLGGVTSVQAEEGGSAAKPAEGANAALTIPAEPTMADTSPTLDDPQPTIGQVDDASAGHAASPAPAEGDHAAAPAAEEAPAKGVSETSETGLPEGMQAVCPPTDAAAAAPVAEHGAADATDAAPAEAAPAEASHGATAEGADFAAGMTGPDCVTLVDAIPTELGPDGMPVPMVREDGQTMSEKAILERLAERRTELETYQQELDLRASLVDAAEKKIEERQATLQALETQISTLVDQRKEMETGQFSGIITLYENMKPKDAANIFNSLDMEVLLRVAKGMNPRKMSPILAAMDAARAQELTVRMAALADLPPEQMTPADISALPQIVGQ